jgi:hypothetical protein
LIELVLRTARQNDSSKSASGNNSADVLNKFCGTCGLSTSISRKLQSELKHAFKSARNSEKYDQVHHTCKQFNGEHAILMHLNSEQEIFNFLALFNSEHTSGISSYPVESIVVEEKSIKVFNSMFHIGVEAFYFQTEIQAEKLMDMRISLADVGALEFQSRPTLSFAIDSTRLTSAIEILPENFSGKARFSIQVKSNDDFQRIQKLLESKIVKQSKNLVNEDINSSQTNDILQRKQSVAASTSSFFRNLQLQPAQQHRVDEISSFGNLSPPEEKSVRRISNTAGNFSTRRRLQQASTTDSSTDLESKEEQHPAKKQKLTPLAQVEEEKDESTPLPTNKFQRSILKNSKLTSKLFTNSDLMAKFSNSPVLTSLMTVNKTPPKAATATTIPLNLKSTKKTNQKSAEDDEMDVDMDEQIDFKRHSTSRSDLENTKEVQEIESRLITLKQQLLKRKKLEAQKANETALVEINGNFERFSQTFEAESSSKRSEFESDVNDYRENLQELEASIDEMFEVLVTWFQKNKAIIQQIQQSATALLQRQIQRDSDLSDQLRGQVAEFCKSNRVILSRLFQNIILDSDFEMVKGG